MGAPLEQGVVGDEERCKFNMSVTLHCDSELKQLLLKAGFSHVQIYGGLKGEPYDHTAKRLVRVAKKGGVKRDGAASIWG